MDASSGVIYVADSGANRLAAIYPNGTVATVYDETAAGCSGSPSGVAAGPDSTVYFTDICSGQSYMKRLFLNGSVVASALTRSGENIQFAGYVAVNSSGAVVFECFPSSVSELLPDGSVLDYAYSSLNPRGLAFDAEGALFVADLSFGIVTRFFTNGSSAVVATGLNVPLGVAVDARGDLIVVDAGNALVKKYYADGTFEQIGSGFLQPTGVAVGSDGNTVFVADAGTGVISKARLGIPMAASPRRSPFVGIRSRRRRRSRPTRRSRRSRPARRSSTRHHRPSTRLRRPSERLKAGERRRC